MAKVIVWNILSLDGYFEGTEKWDLSLHEYGWGEEMEAMSKEFGQRAQCLVFGRVTHDGMKAHWTQAADGEITRFMNALPKLVASRTITSSDWNNTRVTADIVGEIAKLRTAPGKDVLVFGSAELIDSLLEANQIDEMILGVVPVRLGAGTPLFKQGGGLRKLELLENRALRNGTVIMRYGVHDAG